VNPSFQLSDAALVLALGLILLSPFAIAGIALQNSGLARSRSAAHSLLGVMALFATAAIVFLLIGSAWLGAAGQPAHVLTVAGYAWDWCGKGAWFGGALSGASATSVLTLLLDLVLVGLAAIIPWGSGAERWRLGAAVASTVLIGGLFFPLLAHWVWAGGWLSTLGTTFGLGSGVLETSGALPVHLLGGATALAIIWILGARNGKFPKPQVATAIPGHNVVYVLLSCPLTLIGWYGLNGASALLFLHLPLAQIPLIEINTTLCAGAALLATLAITRFRFGKPDASLCANGWLGGLVASSAVAAHVSAGTAIFTGVLAGLLTPLMVELLELALSIDDPSGGVSVHGGNAILGLLIVGVAAGKQGQLLAQIVGIATVLGFALPVGYLLNALLNRYLPYRVDPDGERVGLDVHELGAGSYPEFIIHRDEFHSS
jgi:Amt family ammonium transporter